MKLVEYRQHSATEKKTYLITIESYSWSNHRYSLSRILAIASLLRYQPYGETSGNSIDVLLGSSYAQGAVTNLKVNQVQVGILLK